MFKMKKISLLIVTFLSIFILVSCTNDSNFKDLDRNYMPNKVTQSFMLPKGDFVWTSNNEDVIKVEDNQAIVTQDVVDVLVILTASSDDRKENFDVLVLKNGSGLSVFEKAQEFMKSHSEILIDFEGLYIDKRIDDLYLSFDDNQNDNNSTPTYSDEGEYIYISYLDLNHRFLNIYFNEMIEGELVRVHVNVIKLIYRNEEDIFYNLRPFNTYLEEGIQKLYITNKGQLNNYLETLNLDIVDQEYLTYLNGIKESSYFLSNNSLLLIRIVQISSDNDVRVGNIKIKDGSLIVDLNTKHGSNEAMRFWDFVIEIKNGYSAIKDVLVNINYVEESKLYLEAFTYNFGYLDELEERLFVIDSLEDLENYIGFIDENNGYYGDRHYHTLYYKHLLKYDESYFLNKKLILFNYNAGSGSFEFVYQNYELIGNQLLINLKFNNPQIGTDDIRPWNFIIEVNKLLEFDEVDIKFSRNNFDWYPISKRQLETITFGNDDYQYESVYRPLGNLLEHLELLESKFNIDFNNEIILIENKEVYEAVTYRGQNIEFIHMN